MQLSGINDARQNKVCLPVFSNRHCAEVEAATWFNMQL